MTQTLAIFLDAYRELNSRKLFWITLIICGIAVLAFVFVGINENGLRVFAWDIAFPGLNSKVIPPDMFYKLMFLNLGMFWLTWIATILALVSTAGIFPDFISAGSIDLVLAKPMGRLRLFLTKYATGLMFVGLQVSVFAVASFFVLGIKGGVWEPALFLAIPLVTVFYSYLFSVCVLLGLLTRSTIASLLITVIFWFFMFAIGAVENAMVAGKAMLAQQMQSEQMLVDRYQSIVDRMRNREGATAEEIAATTKEPLENLNKAQSDLDDARSAASTLGLVHNIVLGVKTFLPKTSDTIALLNRSMVSMDELEKVREEAAKHDTRRRNRDPDGDGVSVDVDRVQIETEQTLRDRSLWWVLGTSLGFEAFVLALAAFIFCRRDF